MKRDRSASAGLGELAFGLSLFAVLAFRPEWIIAAGQAYARFWDGVASPILIRMIFGG